MPFAIRFIFEIGEVPWCGICERQFDKKLQAMSASTLGSEWSFERSGKLHREVVLARCDHAIRRGVPAPVAAGKIQSRTVKFKQADLEALAAAAVDPERCEAIRRNLGDPSMQVICKCHLET